jgi:hypothetical protein
MNKFWLIQRGSFEEDLSKNFYGLTGMHGLVELDYMGSAEFEFNAIPHAYRRILHHMESNSYDYYVCEDIKDANGDPFILFCKKEQYENIKEELKSYIEKPYRLKSFFPIKDHITGEKTSTDFFWCIDRRDTGDWIGWFGESKLNTFKEVINNDYTEWWLAKSQRERNEEYSSSLNW